MKSILISSFILASTVFSAPTSDLTKRGDPTEVDVLQYALTLEHLENAFYSTYLAKYPASSFKAAGFPDFVRGRLVQIGEHEASHVKFLSDALTAAGVKPTDKCEYGFPVTDVKSFVGVAEVLEGVGVTAYLGAAQFIKTPGYLTAAGSILTTEARHNAWIGSVGLKGTPWSGGFDSPQTLNEVFSLAAPFIKSCPSTNPPLPVKAFPALTVTISGKTALVKSTVSSSGKFLALLTGLKTSFVPIDGSGKVTLPTGLQGTVYAVLSSNGTSVSDATTVAGPAILTFPIPSNVSN